MGATFVPFIIESGGRVGEAALAFVEEIVSSSDTAQKDASRISKAISRSLVRQQCFMLKSIIQEIPEPD